MQSLAAPCLQCGIGYRRDSLQSPSDMLLPKLRWLMGKSSLQVRSMAYLIMSDAILAIVSPHLALIATAMGMHDSSDANVAIVRPE